MTVSLVEAPAEAGIRGTRARGVKIGRWLAAWAILGLVCAVPIDGIAFAQGAATSAAAPAPEAMPSVEMAPSESQSWAKQAGLDFSLRGAYWSSDRDLDDQTDFSTGSFWLRAQPRFNDHWSARMEGWLQAQSSEAGGKGKQELREAYLAYADDAYDIRAGRQIVVWGRADAINPTDNISSRDFTMLFPEVDDLRRGNGMVRVGRAFDGYTVSALWLPEFRPSVFPTPALPAGVHFGKDDNPQQLDQSAFKLDRSGGTVDWSVSYFDGLDRNQDVAIQSVDFTGVTLQRRYHRIRVYGSDFAFNLGRFGLRGEAAYTDTANPSGNDPEIKKPFFFAVLGADRTFFEYLNVNVQYLFRQTGSYQDPHSIANPLLRTVAIQNATASGQLTPTQNGMSTRIGYKWLHETLEAEVAAAGYFEKGDNFIRTKVIYHWTDTLRTAAGREDFNGPDESFYGFQKKNSATYAELACGF